MQGLKLNHASKGATGVMGNAMQNTVVNTT